MVYSRFLYIYTYNPKILTLFGLIFRRIYIRLKIKPSTHIYIYIRLNIKPNSVRIFELTTFCSSLDGIWTHTIDTLQHQSLNLMSSVQDHSATSAILKYSVTLSRKETIEIDIWHVSNIYIYCKTRKMHICNDRNNNIIWCHNAINVLKICLQYLQHITIHTCKNKHTYKT